MLTKSDLKAIKEIVLGAIAPLAKRLDDHDVRFDSLEKRLRKMSGSMKWWFRKQQRDHNTIISYFENEDRKIIARVERLERHAGLPIVN